MNIVEIRPMQNGAHRNRNSPWETVVPDGWALIPDNFVLPESYPFVTLTAEDVDGVPTVTAMEGVEKPEREPEPEDKTLTVEEQLAALQTAQEDTDALLVDQEYRLTLLELGIDAETFLV